jgi:hypothetical protein
VQPQFVWAVQAADHRQVEQAPRLPVEALAPPHRAPTVLGDQFLHRHAEAVGCLERRIDKFLAEHCTSDFATLLERCFIHFVSRVALGSRL